MAYFDMYKSAEDQQQGPAGSTSIPSSQLTQYFGGGASTPNATLGPAVTGATIDQTRPDLGNDSSGSDFVNYNQYYNANKDVASRGAENVASTVTNNADRASNTMADLYNQFSGEVNAGTGTGPLGRVTVIPGQGQTASQIEMGAAQTPVAEQSKAAVVPSSIAGRQGGKNPVSVDPNATTPGGTGAEAPASKTGAAAAPFASTAPGASSPVQPTPANPAAAPGSVLGGPTGPATLTRDDLVKGAGQKYTGPQSLSQMPGYDAATGQVTNATSQANALNSKAGLSGLLAQQFGGAAEGSGANELDTSLLGTAGKSRFNGVYNQYHDALTNKSNEYNSVGAGQVQQAKNSTQAMADTYGNLLRNFDSVEQKRNDDNAAKAAQDAATAASKKKAQTFDQYNAGNHESVVRDATNFLDPTWYMRQAGLIDESLNDDVSNGWEGMTKGARDSSHVRDTFLDGSVKAEWPEVYNDLTPEELKQVEGMNINQQKIFIHQRYQKLHGQQVMDTPNMNWAGGGT